MTIDMSQFYQVFFEESSELLEEMERLLLELDVSAPGKDDLNAIFRTAHSIKGGSATFGFNEITETTHILESLLDKLRNQEMALRSDMVDVFLKAVDVIRMQLAGRQSGSDVDDQAVSEIRAQLSALAQGGAAVGAAAAAPPAPPAPPAAPGAPLKLVTETGLIDPSPENLFALLTGEPAQGPARVPGQVPTKGAAGQVEPPKEEEAYGFFGAPPAEPELQAAAAEAPVGEHNAGRRALDHTGDAAKLGRRASDHHVETETTSIRVGVEKVDQLINLVGELVITQAMLAQTASRVDPVLYESLLNGLGQLEHNTRDLQESVMSIRMMPISFVFSRFPRVVRDLAGKLNKQVELKTVGEGTELDKGLIEKIADPLNHLVRNSLDHGIESPETRIAAGKPAQGTIILRAFHQGGNIVIEVEDDGAGLDRQRILAKARERGMPVNDALSDQEVWQLIFEAGFSTAETVTAVSGRGVGMDVVKRNVHAMGGRIEMDSSPGLGTRISVRLPLTLAILDGMSVSVGSEIFIIPLTFIVESLQPSTEDTKSIAGQGTVVHVRGEYLPVVTLREVLNVRSSGEDPEQGIFVIVEAEGCKTALFVDDLLGQHQVVIKSLESNYRKVRGVSGATIMGDGKVALILDIEALVRMSRKEERKAA